MPEAVSTPVFKATAETPETPQAVVLPETPQAIVLPETDQRVPPASRPTGQNGWKVSGWFPKLRPDKVNIGLAVATATMLMILIICFATFGWVVDYSTLSCDFSLEEMKCDGHTFELDGDLKDTADVMIGMGAMSFIFLFINLCMNVVISLKLKKFTVRRCSPTVYHPTVYHPAVCDPILCVLAVCGPTSHRWLQLC